MGAGNDLLSSLRCANWMHLSHNEHQQACPLHKPVFSRKRAMPVLASTLALPESQIRLTITIKNLGGIPRLELPCLEKKP